MGKDEVLEEKRVLMSICSPQISYELNRDGTWVSAMRGWQINAQSQGES
jgi:hypothetical protein